MTAKRFRSKIDAWLVVLMLVAVGGTIVAFAAAVYAEPRAGVIAVASISLILLVFLIGSTLFRTHYTVDDKTLRIVSGPFHWTVPIDQITAVEATRSPLSSPALSLDRLRIRYAGKKSVMISPDDKKKFLKALGMEISD